jgi:hypothetical protein
MNKIMNHKQTARLTLALIGSAIGIGSYAIGHDIGVNRPVEIRLPGDLTLMKEDKRYWRMQFKMTDIEGKERYARSLHQVWEKGGTNFVDVLAWPRFHNKTIRDHEDEPTVYHKQNGSYASPDWITNNTVEN